MTKRQSESGNIFFMLFGAVALVGVVAASTSTLMRGPLSTVVNVNARAKADTQMQIAAKLAMVRASQQALSGDCDADGNIEPIPALDASPKPAGGGQIPASIGASQKDPWGNAYGYCVWDIGTKNADGACAAGAGEVTRLKGDYNNNYPVMVIVSSGPDRVFQTQCNDWNVDPSHAGSDPNVNNYPDNFVGTLPGQHLSALSGDVIFKPINADDIVISYTYDQASQVAGGLWSLMKTDPNKITTNKDVDIQTNANFASGKTATFQGAANFDAGSRLDLGFGRGANQGGLFKLPDNTALPDSSCSVANDGALRLNVSGTHNALQICDGRSAPPIWVDPSASGMSVTKIDDLSDAVASFSSQSKNIVLGDGSGLNFTSTSAGHNNVLLGVASASALSAAGADNVILGSNTATSLTTGSHNIILGSNINVAASTSNSLNIGNLIYGTGMTGTGTTSAGNVGIGTATPNVKLEVAGSVQATQFQFNSSNALAMSGGDITLSYGGVSQLFVNGNGLGVGISPTHKLDVDGDAYGQRFISTFSSASTLPGFAFGGDITTGIAHPSGSTIGFTLGGSEKARLTSTGLGIGVSSPSVALDVVGAGAFSSYVSAVTSFNFGSANGMYNQAGNISFNTGGSPRVYVTSGGLGVGLATPMVSIDAAGAIRPGMMITCDSTTHGAIRYGSGDALEYCSTDNAWYSLVASGGGGGGANLWTNNTSYISRANAHFINSSQTLPSTLSSAGTRFFWYPDKAAFRAGGTSGAQWSDANIGIYSAALGYDSLASGQYSFATGNSATASGNYSFGAGRTIDASGNSSVALGQNLTTSGTNSVALGYFGVASGASSIMMGQTADATGANSFALGLGVAAGTRPVVSGARSFGIFMGDQSGRNITSDNTMELLGGKFLIDANPLFASSSIIGTSLSMDVNGNVGAEQYCDSDGSYCFTAQSISSGAVGVFENASNIIRLTSGTVNYASASYVFGSPVMDDDNIDSHRTRMLFKKSNGAFRAGTTFGNQWDSANLGANSAAFGNVSVASGAGAFAAGDTAHAYGNYSVAMGYAVTASGNQGATAFGEYSTASGATSMAFGRYVTASNVSSIAMGLGGQASGAQSGIFSFGSATGSLPNVSAANSVGFMLGNQGGVNLSSPNTFGVFGGKMVIDPASPATQVSARGVLDLGAATDAIVLPAGVTGQRPGSAVNGMLRYNSTNGKFEGYQGGAWQDILTGAIAGGAAAPDRGVQFNSGNSFAAVSTFAYTSAGNLGLGTASPVNMFDVTGNADVRGWMAVGGTAQIDAAGTNPALSVYGNLDITNGTLVFYGGGNRGIFSSSGYLGNWGSTVNFNIQNPGGINVGIGTSTPQAQLDVAGTGAMIVPRGITSERPASGVNGMLRYNSANGKFEGYQAGAWQDILTGAGIAGAPDRGIQFNSGNSFAAISTFTYTSSGRLGVGTASPATMVDIAGTLKVADGGEACSVTYKGGIRFTSVNTLQYCNGTSWVSTAAGSGVMAIDDLTDAITQYSSGGSMYLGSGVGASGTGGNNTALGTNALSTVVNLSGNTAMGAEAMRYVNNTVSVGAGGNSGFGYQALRGSASASSNTGINNTGIGYQTLMYNTTGFSNTATGGNALYGNSTGYNNTATGQAALFINNTGNNNTATGTGSLYTNSTGSGNTATGNQAMSSNLSGNFNTANGAGALFYNSGKHESTAIGYNAMYYADSASTSVVTNNTALGAYALRGSTTAANNTGTANTAIGHSSLLGITTGSNNVALGYAAGSTTTTGVSNILIGSGVTATAATTSYWLNIGNAITGDMLTGNLAINGTGALTLPVGVNGTRPGAPVNGMLRYNSASGKFEGYQAGSWQDILTGAIAGGAAAPDRGIQFNSGNSFYASSNLLYTSSGDLLVSGTYTGTPVPPATGAGSRMFFDPSSGAFRAGQVTGTAWNAANIGVNSFAAGYDTTASGGGSAAFGQGTNATAPYSTAFGYNATAGGTGAVAMGNSNLASNTAAIAMGWNTVATGVASTTIGKNIEADGDYSMAIGLGNPALVSRVTGTNSLGIFMNDSASNVTFASSNTMGIFGGKVVIDPTALPTYLYARTALDVNGSIKVGDGGETCSTTVKGAIRYTSVNTLQYCNGTSWTSTASGSFAAAPDRGIQFNSGNNFAASSNLVYSSGGALLVTGTYVGVPNLPTSGVGSRMMFDPNSGSFRAGAVTGTKWDMLNTGNFSVGFGLDTQVKGNYSVGMGQLNTVNGDSSVGLGYNNSITANSGVALGASGTVSGTNGITIGGGNTASGLNALAMGNVTTASGVDAIAIGTKVTVGNGTAGSGLGDFSLGWGLGNAAGTAPSITGVSSLGIFMGDQSALVMASSNTMGLYGGRFVIDPAVPSTYTYARTALDVNGSLKIGDGGETCATLVKGAIRYTSVNTLQFCNGTAWTSTATGAGVVSVDDLSDAITNYTSSATASTNSIQSMFIGSGSGVLANTSAGYNTAIGVGSMVALTGGTSNTAVGYRTLYTLNTGTNNTAMGYAALRLNDTGSYNTAYGYGVLANNTNGINNTGVGTGTLSANTTGTGNTGNGYGALFSNVAKQESTAVGYSAMYYADSSATAGVTYNTAIGTYALRGSVTAASNTGTGNTAVGHNSLKNVSSGSGNLGVGASTGLTLATGSRNLLFGSSVDVPAASTSDYLSIGNLIFGSGGMGTGTTVGTGFVGIRTATPRVSLDVVGTDALMIPAGNNSTNRPTGGNVANGMIRYNTTDTRFEGYQNGSWMPFSSGGSAAVVSIDDLTDAATNYTGSVTASSNSLYSMFFGTGVGATATAGAARNTGLGYLALASLTTGTDNIAIGNNAGQFISTGSNNYALGSGAMTGVTGAKLTGNNNVAIGQNALNAAQGVAAYNIAIGQGALAQTTTGDSNVAVGQGTLASNVGGKDSTAVGQYAMANAYSLGTVATYNTAVGNAALAGSPTPSANSGTFNTAIGHSAMLNNTSGTQNTAVGALNLQNNTTGTYNTAIGVQALVANSTGNNNVSIGVNAMYANSAKSESVAVGYGAMQFADNTATPSVTYNTAVGSYALQGSLTAANNTGRSNTAIGHTALASITSGSNNTAIGAAAGVTITTGSGNLLFGSGINTPAATTSNFLSIGNLIFASGGFGTDVAVGTGFVGIRTATPRVSLDVVGTDALMLPAGNNSTNRPTGGNLANGMIRYNTTDTRFEGYQNGSWLPFSSAIPGATSAGGATTQVQFNSGGVLGASANFVYDVTNNIFTIANSGTGSIRTGAGTAFLPSFSFAADTDTGLYNSGANSLDVSAGGGRVVQFTSVSTGVNYLTMAGAATGASPTISNGGSDTNGAGLGLNITGKAATAAGAGGPLVFTAGAGNGAGAGGANSLVAGAGGSTGAGGAVTITTGAGGSTSGSSGTLTIGTGTTTSGTIGSILAKLGATTYMTIQPPSTTSASVVFGGTDAVTVPAGTQGQRPSVGVNGMIRYNSTDGRFEGYQVGSWLPFSSGGAASTLALDDLTDVATNYTGTASASTNSTQSMFFGTGAGSSAAVGASRNIAIGYYASNTLSTAVDNITMGYAAGQNVTTGQSNIAIGTNALTGISGNPLTGGFNVAIGQGALTKLQGAAAFNVAIGQNSLTSTTVGINNVGIGQNTLVSNVSGSDSTAIGQYAMANANSAGGAAFTTYNTAVGVSALSGSGTPANNTGKYNTALGHSSINGITSGSNNTGVGVYALTSLTTGSSNIAFGSGSAQNLTTGSSNIFIGSGINSPAVGTSNYMSIGNLIYASGGFGTGTTVGTGFVGIRTSLPRVSLDVVGTDAIMIPAGNNSTDRPTGGNLANGMMRYNTTNTRFEGYQNGTWLPFSSGGSVPTLAIDDLTDAIVNYTSSNMYLGTNVGSTTTSGNQNTGVGVGAMAAVTTANTSTAVGYGALAALNTGNENTAIGRSAGLSLTNGQFNVALGDQAMQFGTGSTYNVALGSQALSAGWPGSNPTVARNIAIGYAAMYAPTSAADNQGIGDQALNAVTSGFRNTAIGSGALDALNTGSNNIAVGYNAGFAVLGGTSNILIGGSAGANLTTGSGNLLFGSAINAPAVSTSNYMSIGNVIFASGGFGTGTSVGAGFVGIRTALPRVTMDITGTDAIMIPAGNNSTNRPTGGNLANGMMRYNTTDTRFEGYQNGAWLPFSSASAGAAVTAAGSNLQVQYNNGGVLGASSTMTFTSSTNTLAVTGIVSVSDRINITGTSGLTAPTGIALSNLSDVSLGTLATGKVLTYNGTAWAATTPVAGVAGSTTQIQYNNAGALAGSGNFTWTNASSLLTVTGDISYSGVLTDTSDRRLKTDIAPLSDKGSMLDKLGQLGTYSYHLKRDMNTTQYGVIAQEIKEVFPELVRTDENSPEKYLSVNYTGLIAPLIEASKELKAENDNLKTQVAQMKSEREEVQASLQDLQKDIKGLKVRTGYGIDKAGMDGWMLLLIGVIFGGGSVMFFFGGMVRAQRGNRE